MDVPYYAGNFLEKPNKAAETRVGSVIAAVIFSFLFHVSAGWYLLNVVKDLPVQPPRRPLEFTVMKPSEPIIAPTAPIPQQSFVSPKPLPISPRPTVRVVPQPKAKQAVAPPTPIIESPNHLTEIQETIQSPPSLQTESTESSLSSLQENSITAELSSLGENSGKHSPGGIAGGGSLNEPPVGGETVGSPDGTAGGGYFIGPAFDAAYLSNPVPDYPPAARKLRLEGTTIVRVLVNPEGRAEVVQLEKSSGASVLDGAALKAVKKWLFVPARSGNKPVSAWVDVPIRFRLN